MLGSGLGRVVGFGFVQYLGINGLGGCGFGRAGDSVLDGRPRLGAV